VDVTVWLLPLGPDDMHQVLFYWMICWLCSWNSTFMLLSFIMLKLRDGLQHLVCLEQCFCNIHHNGPLQCMCRLAVIGNKSLIILVTNKFWGAKYWVLTQWEQFLVIPSTQTLSAQHGQNSYEKKTNFQSNYYAVSFCFLYTFLVALHRFSSYILITRFIYWQRCIFILWFYHVIGTEIQKIPTPVCLHTYFMY
jgi:hypothetical protein